MKSSDKAFVKRTYSAVLKDCADTYPHLVRSFLRDEKTIYHMIDHRGLGYYTLDLPLLDQLLLEGLETGSLPKCFYLFGEAHRARVPRLFAGLWLMVFDQCGCLLSRPDPTAILFLRQLSCMWKKLEVACSLERVRKTVDEYEKIEQSLPKPTLAWGADDVLFHESARTNNPRFSDYLGGLRDRCGSFGLKPELLDGSLDHHGSDIHWKLLERLDQLSRKICGSLPHFDPWSLSARREPESWRKGFKNESAFRHGPGAVADGRKGLDKYNFPTWSSRLSSVFPIFPFGKTSSHPISSIPSDRDTPSKLIGVPKTRKAPRLIASEPTSSQWCQQMVSEYLFESLYGWRSIVHTKDQSVSRKLVETSSRNGTLATIDLSSASDRLSCSVVERIFIYSPSVLSALNAVRTPYISNRIKGTRPFLLKSRKYASQGTACTFPVQSFVFALIAMAACGYTSVKQASGKVRVFGDDIIVPKEHVGKVMSLLHLLGLSVNVNKSFHNGKFRESCGMDAFDGYNVTPLKFVQLPSPKPTVTQAYFDYSNNAFKSGMWNLSELLRRESPLTRGRQVTKDPLDESNLYSFSGERSSHLKSRWNDDLQRFEVRCRLVINKPEQQDRAPLSRLMHNQHSRFGKISLLE